MEKKIEEQIHEMAHCLCGQKNCAECPSDYRCEFITMSSILIKAGYRKQSEGEWIEKAFYFPKCSCCDKDLGEFIDGEDIRIDLPPYCPNCDAHMKGGAE